PKRIWFIYIAAVPFTTRGSPRKSSRVRLQDHGRVRQARFPDETGSSYPWPCPPLASLRYSLLQWTRKEDWREEEKVSVRGCIVSQDLSVLKTIVFLFIA
ncbi:BnaCnng76340D, partial [Brassica napus]